MILFTVTPLWPLKYIYLKELNVPFITHVHEMEESIKKYTSEENLKVMKEYTDVFIPCSPPVMTNLVVNHDIDEDRQKLVHSFKGIEK